ncbi:hypothetical protein C8F04DRAFT_1201260 [Mycena alexandri]|uniref:Uncharacterized protein n=1 Tax=Mycena alexandri TaxID=1745969 RepID=A0AAD6RX39_9AGAR|nr:hypothetical protein C8F04DRAFT_1201260 [Mycena alexandri]
MFVQRPKTVSCAQLVLAGTNTRKHKLYRRDRSDEVYIQVFKEEVIISAEFRPKDVKNDWELVLPYWEQAFPAVLLSRYPARRALDLNRVSIYGRGPISWVTPDVNNEPSPFKRPSPFFPGRLTFDHLLGASGGSTELRWCYPLFFSGLAHICIPKSPPTSQRSGGFDLDL